MPALHIRNVDDAVIDALKDRARRHHRSLEGELRAIIERAAFSRDGQGRGRVRVDIRTVSVGAESTYDREEIYDDEG